MPKNVRTYVATVAGGDIASNDAALTAANLDFAAGNQTGAATKTNATISQTDDQEIAGLFEDAPEQADNLACQLHVDIVRNAASTTEAPYKNDRAVLAELVRCCASNQETRVDDMSSDAAKSTVKSVYVRVEFHAS